MHYFATSFRASTTRQNRFQILWPILFIITLALCALTVQHFITGQAEAEHAESYALRLNGELTAILQASTDIETGARGYALTRAKVFLDPHEIGKANMQAHLQQLRSLLENDNEEKVLYDELLSFVMQRIETANELIAPELNSKNDVEARGKTAQDGLRRVIATMSENVNKTSKKYQEQAQNFRTTLRVALILSPVLLAILVLLWWRAIVHWGRARESLRLAEVRSGQIIEQTPNGIATVDQGGRIISANPSLCRILGFNRGELDGVQYRSLIDHQDGDGATGAIQALEQDGKSFYGELCLMGKHGNPVWMKVTISWLQAGADVERCSLIVAKNITEQKAAQEKLQRSEALVRNASRLAGIDAWSLRLPEMKITIGEYGRAMLNLDQPARLSVQGVLRLLSGPSRRRLLKEVLNCMRYDRDFDVELQLDNGNLLLRVMGQAIRIDASTVRLEGAMKNVTAQRRNEAALRKSEERFRAIAQVTNDAIWEWDRSNDSTWRRACSRESSFLAGTGIDCNIKQWVELLHPDDRDAVTTSFANALAGPDHEWAAEYRYLRHDGSYRNVADRAMLLRDVDGHVTHAVGGMRDLTDARRMQKAMMQMAASVVGDHSSDFFRTLLSNLISGLGADAGGIARLNANGISARTLAFKKDGQIYDNFEFEFVGTPFAELIEKHECFIENDPQLPQRDTVTHFDAGAFFGATLFGVEEQLLGFIFVMYDQSPEKSDFLSSALRVFATRASAEIERIDADILLREQAELLDHAQEAIIVLNLDLTVRYWNSGAEKMYGWSHAEAKRLGISSTYDDENATTTCIESVLEHGEWYGELPQRHRDGRALISEERWTLIRTKDGEPYSVLKISSDITARKTAEEQIRKLAHFDSLTGLPNRSLFMDRIEQARSRAARSKRPGALLFIDMDNFKNLNDLHGHNVGDAFLRATALRMSFSIRSGDTVARLGGDEFVVILENLKDEPDDAIRQAQAVAEKLLTALAKPFDLDGIRHYSTASIGIALFHDGLDPLDDLLGRADIAMYSAKASGRNTCRVYSHTLQQFHTRSVIPEELRTAIDENQLELWYQPQYKADGTLYGAEALLRWRHPKRGLLFPGDFIPIAEQGGLIVLLGNWVLTTACQQLADWSHRREMASLDISVNISPRQLYQDGFVEEVLAIVDNAGAPAKRLTLEITESVFDDTTSKVEEKIAQLQQREIRFSLDDFGTGYSSLSRLRRLPLDELKIDRSFISDMEHNSTSRAIVAMILTLGRAMELHVVAEGIETQAQRDMLVVDGCNAFQGYFLGRPMTQLDFEALQQTNNTIVAPLVGHLASKSEFTSERSLNSHRD